MAKRKFKYDVFISYNASDRDYAERIALLLRANGINFFYDVWDLNPGEMWSSKLIDVIQNCQCVLVLLGQYSISKRGWVQTELSMSMTHRDRISERLIVPILLPNAKPSNIPGFLRQFMYFDLREWKDSRLNRLVAELTNLLNIQIESEVKPKVFLCHAKEDDIRVADLYLKLRDEDLDPWYDKEKLDVGDRWEEEIINAIESSDFFTICLSPIAVKKEGFIQKEIRTAIREFQRRAFEFAYLLPVRLEICEVPKIKIDENTTLRSLQWIDLLEGDNKAFQKFVKGIFKQWRKKNA